MANAEFDFAPSDLQQGPASSKLQGETGERRARSHKGTEVRRIKQLNRMMMTLVRTPRENPSVAQGIEFPNTGSTAHPIGNGGWAGAPGRGVWTNMKNSRPLPLGSRG